MLAFWIARGGALMTASDVETMFKSAFFFFSPVCKPG
jgi:hypothetical protein